MTMPHSSNARPIAWLAWGIAAATILFGLLSVILLWLNQRIFDSVVVVNIALNSMVGGAFALVGALIVSRQKRNLIGWLMLIAAFSLNGTEFLGDYAIYNLLVRPEPLPGALFAAWVSNWLWVGVTALVFLPWLFPTGRPRTRRGYWAVGGMVVLTLVFLLFSVVAPEIRIDRGDSAKLILDNPSAILPKDWMAPIEGAAQFLFVLFFLLFSLGVVSLGLRFRNGTRQERQQIKWLLAAVALSIAVMIPSLLSSVPSWYSNLIPNLTVLGIPIAIGIAILRYRLYDIDLIIRKTLTYALVVALLLIVYFGSIILLQQIFANLTGLQGNEIVTVLSTLVIAALFIPLRNRIQNIIDKRFYRKKYDAQKVLQKFSETVRDETDLDKLTAELVDVVQETMQPKSVSVWLKRTDDDRRQATEK